MIILRLFTACLSIGLVGNSIPPATRRAQSLAKPSFVVSHWSLVAASLTTNDQQPTTNFEKRFPFPTSGEIEVENPRGRILVIEGAPDQIRLIAEGAPTPVLADDLKILVGKARIRLKCLVKDEHRVVDLHLTVPSAVRLKLRAEEGTVQVHGSVSSVRVETLSGDVVLGLPTDDLKVEATWMEGYPRYAGPPLQRTEARAVIASPTRGAGPPPAVLVGKIGQGRVQVNVRTLNGWVEIGSPTIPDRVVLGAVLPQPLSRAARALASSRESQLGLAIRFIEPRLQWIFEQAGMLPAQRPAGTEEEEAIRLEAPLVNLNASVTDVDGKALSGLKAEDFIVTEGGEKQRITHFATEVSPFNLVLLLDVSGSARGKLDVIKEAALRFIEIARPSDKIALMLFARDVEVVAHLTGDRDLLKQAISRVEPPLGSTALYDAIGYALVEELSRVRGERNAIVVLTDGRDSSMAYAETPLANDPLRRPGSFLRFSDLVNGVLQTDALIYPIMLENEAELAATLIESAREQVRAGTRHAREQLKQLADISGGRFYRAVRLENLEGVYEQIVADLRTIYSFAYMPTRAERDGTWRAIQVTVSRPGARVRSRRGYFAR